MSKSESKAQPKPQTAYDAQAWLAQMSDPKGWQSMMNLMQSGMPGMSGISGHSETQNVMALVPQEKLMQMQQDYTEKFSALWSGLMESKTPEISDRRFSAPAWHANPLYAFNVATYLLNAQFLNALAESVEVDEQTKKKIRFATQQTVDAMSPANFLATNPEAQQLLIDSKGESLQRGIMQMLTDMRKGHISQTDETAFEVGRNVAASEGSVVFENDVII